MTPVYTPGEGRVGPWKLVAFPYGGPSWRVLEEREEWDAKRECWDTQTRLTHDRTVYTTVEDAEKAIARMKGV